MENSTPVGFTVDVPAVPDWLAPAPQVRSAQIVQNNVALNKELLHTQYEAIFMRVLDEMSSGKTLTQVIASDFRGFKSGAFLRWIMRDAERARMYNEAKELRSEYLAGEVIDIADAMDSEEDVQRSRLRIDARKWIMGADNRKTYGEHKTMDIGGSISILSALDAANNRVIDLVDDVTPRLEE